jgi:glutamate dehydrogenase
MARPELAVLLAYAKRNLTDLLLGSELPDDPHFEADLFEYFPPEIVKRFPDEIRQHPLRRELICTIVANQVLNSQGSTYYSAMRTVTGASAADIVRAYRITRLVTDAQQRWADIEGLNGRVEADTARAMLKDVDGLVTRVSRWYVNNPSELTIDEVVQRDREDFATLSSDLPKIPSDTWRAPYEAVRDEFIDRGVPKKLASRHAYQRALRRGPDIVDLAHHSDRPVAEIAALYTKSSNVLRIGWLERQIGLLPGVTPFERLAIESLRDDLLELRHDIVAAVLAETDASLDAYLENHHRAMPRLERWYVWLAREGILDVAAGVIAVRRLRQLLLGK